MFKFIKRLFNAIFGSKKTEEAKEENVEEVKEDMTPVAPEEEEEIKDVSTSENDKEVEESETVSEEEVVPHEYLTITEEDKEAILNVIRPIIKHLNMDEVYINFCSLLADIATKRLKTFAKLSEDGKVLTVNLTQSPAFNCMLAKFVSEHVVSTFKTYIDAELLGNYEVEGIDGTIYIRKVG